MGWRGRGRNCRRPGGGGTTSEVQGGRAGLPLWVEAELADRAGLSDVRSMIATPAPLTTLGLAGDGDDLDVLVAVERSFGLSFKDEETSSWQTVGDFLRSRFEQARHDGDTRQVLDFDGVL